MVATYLTPLWINWKCENKVRTYIDCAEMTFLPVKNLLIPLAIDSTELFYLLIPLDNINKLFILIKTK
jgi:hypothetical protein